MQFNELTQDQRKLKEAITENTQMIRKAHNELITKASQKTMKEVEK